MQANQLPPPSFNEISLGLQSQGYALVDGFVSMQDVVHILAELRSEEDEFHKAGVGKDNDYQVLHTLRGDYIKWLEYNAAQPVTRRYLELLNDLRTYLNRICYLGLQDHEVHFTKYPVGTRYAKHVDAFSNDDNRRISVVLYLKPSLNQGNGGEICIYPNSKNPNFVSISPLAGRLVVFESVLEHEVLPANIMRYSITGWLLNEKRFF